MRKEIATNGVKAVAVLNAWEINCKTKKMSYRKHKLRMQESIVRIDDDIV